MGLSKHYSDNIGFMMARSYCYSAIICEGFINNIWVLIAEDSIKLIAEGKAENTIEDTAWDMAEGTAENIADCVAGRNYTPNAEEAGTMTK